MNFLTKLLFLINRPTLIIVTGQGRALAAEAIFQVLKNKFSVRKIQGPRKPCFNLRNDALIFELDVKETFNLRFLIRKARETIFIVTALGEVPSDEHFFASEKDGLGKMPEFVGLLPPQSYLVLNFDDETSRELKAKSACPVLTFGFQGGADFQASDVKITERGANFKVNYRGNIVPVWLRQLFGKEQVYSSLSGICAAVALGMNLIEVSQALKSYQSLPGRMRLIEGNKNTKILDDSENSSLQSMLGALAVLQGIKESRSSSALGGRMIAVLGDVLDIGKYALQAHETIGERAAKVCDLLFTVGERAKFIAQGAVKAGMSKENIFSFDDAVSAGRALEETMREGDFILVDGAREMEMWRVVEEIKK